MKRPESLTPQEVFSWKHKVMIAQPSAEEGRYTAFGYGLELVWKTQNTWRPSPVMGLYPCNGQNALARMFLKSDSEYLWLVNDDQLYPQSSLAMLLMAQKDVVIPLALERTPPHFPLIYDQPDKKGIWTKRYLRRGETGLVRVWGCGGGGMLVHRRVFEAIPDPWWAPAMQQNTDDSWYLPSEDLPFCNLVNRAGFEVWCDLDISAIHYATFGLRAVMNLQTGDWATEMSRGHGKVYTPAAANPTGLEDVDRRVIVPPTGRMK